MKIIVIEQSNGNELIVCETEEKGIVEICIGDSEISLSVKLDHNHLSKLSKAISTMFSISGT